MLIKVPLRISFIGGGTDVPPFPEEHGGETISCTIDRYITVSNNDNFDIPKINIYDDLINAIYPHGIHTVKVVSEMPPGTGLGTSSAIAVGLTMLHSNHWTHNKDRKHLTPYDIAEAAIDLERNIVGIEGGLQDQYIASFPGVNRFYFNKDKTVMVKPLIHFFSLKELQSHILLVDTGIIRRQAKIMQKQIGSTSNNLDNLLWIKEAVDVMETHLRKKDWRSVAWLIGESWKRKKLLADGISLPVVDEILEAAKYKDDYVGGKLLGAGGGGYVLLFCNDREYLAHQMTALGYRCILPNIVDKHIIKHD